MSNELVPAIPRHLIAFAPEDMVGIRETLLRWAEARVAQAKEEAAEFQYSADLAAREGLNNARFLRQSAKAMRAARFYEKVKAAIEAGYVIVPNFPIRLFSIRTNRSVKGISTASSAYSLSDLPQHAPGLPAGIGENHSPWPQTTDDKWIDTATDGSKKERITRHVVDFNEVELPLQVVRPEIIEAVGHALRQRIFDEVGIVEEHSKGDPIIVGRVRDGKNGREISFLVAWWLDLEKM